MSVQSATGRHQEKLSSVKALNSVSLDLQGGKIIVLLGVNGAGKTTLMRIMAGLENADEGNCFLTIKTSIVKLCVKSQHWFSRNQQCSAPTSTTTWHMA